MIKLSALRRLVVLGILTEAAYVALLARPFALQRYYATPHLDLGKITGYEPWEAAALAILAIFWLYGLAYRTAGAQAQGKVVIAFGLAFALTNVLVYPIGALDVFDYIFYGREMAFYGANPFVVAPQAFPNDKLFPYVAWSGLPFTYGPLWAIASRLLNTVGRDNLLLNLLLFKGLGVAAYAVTSAIIHDTLRRHSPARAFGGVLFFAWNPLVIFETAANGHNDIVAALFVVIGAAAWARGRQPLGIGGLALSALTKFVTAPLALVWLAAGLRAEKRWRARLGFVAGVVVISAFLALLCYLPFLGERAHWRTVLLAPLQRQDLFTSSFPALVVHLLRDRFGVETTEKLARNGALIMLALYTLYITWRVKGDWQSVARASFNVLLFYLLFLCLWFQPWYVMWIVPLAALLPHGRASIVTFLFCLSAMGKYLVFDFFWFWRPEAFTGRQIEALAVAIIYLLPLAYLALSWRSNGSLPPGRTVSEGTRAEDSR